MAQQNRTTLKTYFETGDTPTEAQFADFVDSCFNPSNDTLDAIPDGTTYKLFTPAERTKLSGIETGADVTDTANVTAAGALMDSELANLAQVKAFNSADYATAAQGAKADTAYQPAGTDVAVADGGTGASTAEAARSNLGVMNIVALTADYTNTSAADTLEDVTNFKFPVVNGGTYYFHIVGVMSVTAASTGFRMVINGPTTSYLGYRNIWPTAATTQSINHGLTAYNLPAAASTATAATAGNVAVIEGILTATASGDVQVRIAAEVAGGGGLTIKAGSIIEYYRVS